MRIEADWLRAPGLVAVMDMLAAGGHRALLVGGCVRNALLAAPVTDMDIATDALPERVVALAEAAGLRPVPTGIAHGTVTVVVAGVPHEVTTFRRDVATDGRRAVVAFTDRLAEDAARRDFTMNALYAEADGRVVDPLGGLPDLLARRLRFVGDAEARIREDYLRILRFFRFHAWYADPEAGMDAEGLAACAANSAGIETLSAERIGAEMRRLLAAPDPGPAVAAMAACGVLAQAMPGADPRALGPLLHLEGDIAPDPLHRLAALGGSVARLRLSKAEARRLEALQAAVAEGVTPAVAGHLLGEGDGAAALRLSVAQGGGYGAAAMPARWQAELARGAQARFPVVAADLMPAYSGPELGQRMKELQARWIASDLRAGRDALLATE